MIKRLLAMLVTLLLAQTPSAPAAEIEENTALLAVNMQAVQAMLIHNEIKYEYHDGNDNFETFWGIDGELDECRAWLIVYDDGVAINADYEVEAGEDKRDELAKYFMRVNNRTRLGNFYIDYENGTIGYEIFLYTGVVAPTQELLWDSMICAIRMAERCGGAVAGILYHDMTAEEAFASY